MNLRQLSILAALAPAVAHAQVAAKVAEPPPHPRAGLGVELGFGVVRSGDLPDGWAGRLMYHLMPALPAPHRVGALFDLAIGYEYWRSGPGTWGTDLPAELELGIRVPGVRAELGVGFDAMLLDQVHGDTGFGLWAPLASATAGIDLWHVTLMADARVTRRWQLGADDHTQWMFTLGLGYTEEPPR